MKVSFSFLWYDVWVGFFWDRKQKIFYFCPLPCCVFKFQSKDSTEKSPSLARFALGNAESKLHAINELVSDMYDALYTIGKELD